jgi:lipoate---protein ligase
MHQNDESGSPSALRVREPPSTPEITKKDSALFGALGDLGDQFNPAPNVTEISLDPEEQLAHDSALFESVEHGASESLYRSWQAARPVVVVGRHSRVAADVFHDACLADGVHVLRRGSGGGAVVLGPGCLNYAVVLSLVSRPELANVAASFRYILERIVVALDIPGLAVAGGTDLALDGRKVSGNAQRRGRRALIHHGTLLFGFETGLATRYLQEPVRQPAYRTGRRHAEFIGNIPLPAETIRERLEDAWSALRSGAGCCI